MSDDELRAMGKNGGVVMVNFFSAFLDPKVNTALRAFYKRHGKELDAMEAKHVKDADQRAAPRVKHHFN